MSYLHRDLPNSEESEEGRAARGPQHYDIELLYSSHPAGCAFKAKSLRATLATVICSDSSCVSMAPSWSVTGMDDCPSLSQSYSSSC